MTDTKNYSKCPLKKRPVTILNEEAVNEPEQDEPVDLRMNKKVKCEEKVIHGVVKQELPLKDITLSQQQHQQPHPKPAAFNYGDREHSVRVGRDGAHSLYNLLPGYQYVQNEPPQYNSHHHDIPIKQEVFSPYTREYSMSPPAADMYMNSSGKIPSNYEEKYHPKLNYTANSSSRYMPYSNRSHLMDEYHQMPPVPSPNSLNSLGSPRSSLSPASTGSLSEDMYQMVAKQSSPLFDMGDNSYQYCEEKQETVQQRYQCSECAKSYSTYSGLTKHKQFHCPATEGNQAKKSFSCKYCDKIYTSLGALKMHIRTHTLPCKCQICGKAFSRPWLLQGHIRTHTGEKPFSCQYCHRAFADRSNLRAHLQTHSDVKKYSCTSCSKTFSRMSLLTKHKDGGCAGELHSSVPSSYLTSHA